MGASSSKKKSIPKFEFVTVNGTVRAVDTKSGLLKRIYYDHHGMLRYQLIEKDHDGALEFSLVSNKHTTMVASKEPLFAPGDSVFVMHTRWVGEWSAFAANGDLQPGPISNDKLVDEDGGFKEQLQVGVHWRAVSKWHFLFFLKTYGISGPVIEFKAPRRSQDTGEGARLVKKDKPKPKLSAAKKGVEESVEEEKEKGGGGGGDDEGEEKKSDEGGGKGAGKKDAGTLLLQPLWMKVVRLEKHATRSTPHGLAASLCNFSTGLPYGVDLGVENPDLAGIKGLGAAAAGALMACDVRASSAHVLNFIDAKHAGRRKVGRLFAVTAALYALQEAGARRRRHTEKALRKADAKERRRFERKRKAAVAWEREKQRRLQATAVTVAAAASGGGGGSNLDGLELVSVGEVPEEAVQTLVAPAEVYGKEFGLMLACSVHRKRFREARTSNSQGPRQATVELACLVFSFGAKQAQFRRAKLAVGDATRSSAEGGLLHGAALGVVQGAWRCGNARSNLHLARVQGQRVVAPLAACLLQATWRRTAVQLGKRKANAARRQALVVARHARLASALQKAFRNVMWRRKVAHARGEVAQQQLAFGAVKVQLRWRRFVAHRLERIAAGEEPPGGYGEDSDEDSDDDDDDDDDGNNQKKKALGAAARHTTPTATTTKKKDSRTKRGFAGMTPEEASHRLSQMASGSRIRLEAQAEGLSRRKKFTAADQVAEAQELREQGEREALAARSEARPVTVRVWCAKNVPLASSGGDTLADLANSELFVVVTALPSPPPPEALMGNTGFESVKTPEKAQRALGVSRPAKTVRTAAAAAGVASVARRGSSSSSSGGGGGGKVQQQAGEVGGAGLKCVDVEFKQEVELSGPEFDGHSTLVFTLLRRPAKSKGLLLSSAQPRDDFLGQATLKLHDLPDLWSGAGGSGGGGAAAAGVRHNGQGGQSRFADLQSKPAEKEVPLAELICRVWDGHGQKLKLERKDASGGGTLKVSFLRQDGEAQVGAWVHAEVTPPKQPFSSTGGGGGGEAGKASPAKTAKAKAAAAAKQALKPREFVTRWVVLSNGKLSVHESPTCEPDLEVGLACLRSCRLVQEAKLSVPDTPSFAAEEGQDELCVYFDAPSASTESVKNKRGTGGSAAAGGGAGGTHGFGTGPKDAKSSAAVSGAAYGRGTLVLRGESAGGDFEVLSKMQRALEKALFTHTHAS